MRRSIVDFIRILIVAVRQPKTDVFAGRQPWFTPDSAVSTNSARWTRLGDLQTTSRETARARPRSLLQRESSPQRSGRALSPSPSCSKPVKRRARRVRNGSCQSNCSTFQALIRYGTRCSLSSGILDGFSGRPRVPPAEPRRQPASERRRRRCYRSSNRLHRGELAYLCVSFCLSVR